jgi:hypothetical protein
MESYFEILQQFSAARVEYCVIGTWALKAYFPKEMREYELHDCDLAIHPTVSNIQNAADILRLNGWELRIWGAEIPELISAELLTGKYYVRAQKAELTLDLSYALEHPNWAQMSEGVVPWEGFSLAALRHIVMLKLQKGKAEDLDLLRQLGLGEL